MCQSAIFISLLDSLKPSRLTFYWLTRHEGLRSTNSGTTHTSISLPDGRSVLFDEDLRTSEAAQLAPRGMHPAQHVTLTCGSESSHSCCLASDTVIDSTLQAWGVQLYGGILDSDVPVAFGIKCTILQVMCAFSQLNLEAEVCDACTDSKDFQMLHSLHAEEELHPSSLAVIELLAPRWQAYPGEQPSIRWGPSERGGFVALAVMHEFACRPVYERDLPNRALLLNMHLFLPQDLNTQSYLSLLGGSKARLEQILQCPRLDACSVEEATSMLNLLGDFVVSSPSFAQAQLVAYSFCNTLHPMEESIFKACEVSKWPPAIFRLFHALLRLFR